MKPRISMITLGVADLERSIQFYKKGLGLPRKPIKADDVAFFPLNGTWLALWGRDSLAADATVPAAGSGFEGFALAHNVASRGEVDRILSQAGAAGARIVKPAQQAFWGGYTGYFADPDGHLWEVAWNPHFWVGPADERPVAKRRKPKRKP
jgi:catechol 2,3-dioxygenase-like lactoylglutathione lyase family enzyme